MLKRTNPTSKRIKQEVGCSFPKVNLKEWCKKWNLKIESRVCPKCNREVFTTIPFETKEYKGLTTPDCKCGYEVRRAVLHTYCEKLKKKYNKVFTEIDKLEVWESDPTPFDNQEIIDFREKCHKDPQVRENWRQINECIRAHDLNEWCKKHDLKVERAYCPTCNEPLQTTLPLEYKNAVGLRCPICPICNERNTPEFSICKDSKMNKLLSGVFKKK